MGDSGDISLDAKARGVVGLDRVYDPWKRLLFSSKAEGGVLSLCDGRYVRTCPMFPFPCSSIDRETIDS